MREGQQLVQAPHLAVHQHARIRQTISGPKPAAGPAHRHRALAVVQAEVAQQPALDRLTHRAGFQRHGQYRRQTGERHSGQGPLQQVELHLAGHDRRLGALLVAIGVQQADRSAVADHRRQPPGQIAGAEDAHRHAVAADRRPDMRRVAGQQDPADPQSLGDPFLEPGPAQPLRVT